MISPNSQYLVSRRCRDHGTAYIWGRHYAYGPSTRDGTTSEGINALHQSYRSSHTRRSPVSSPSSARPCGHRCLPVPLDLRATGQIATQSDPKSQQCGPLSSPQFRRPEGSCGRHMRSRGRSSAGIASGISGTLVVRPNTSRARRRELRHEVRLFQPTSIAASPIPVATPCRRGRAELACPPDRDPAAGGLADQSSAEAERPGEVQWRSDFSVSLYFRDTQHQPSTWRR